MQCIEYYYKLQVIPNTWPCDVVQEKDRLCFVFSDHFLAFPSYKKMPLSVLQEMQRGNTLFCNFTTEVRMDWKELFVIVGLCALLPVWRSTRLANFLYLCLHLFFSLDQIFGFVWRWPPLSQPTVYFIIHYLSPLTTLTSSYRFRKSGSWFQLRTGGEGSVCDGRGIRHGPCPAPHAPGALPRIPWPLPTHGKHWWQRAAQSHSRCQLQWWVLAFSAWFPTLWFHYRWYCLKSPSVQTCVFLIFLFTECCGSQCQLKTNKLTKSINKRW